MLAGAALLSRRVSALPRRASPVPSRDALATVHFAVPRRCAARDAQAASSLTERAALLAKETRSAQLHSSKPPPIMLNSAFPLLRVRTALWRPVVFLLLKTPSILPTLLHRSAKAVRTTCTWNDSVGSVSCALLYPWWRR